MKVVGICGSPRKGNTHQMLSWVLESCKAGSAQTTIIDLPEYNLGPCLGCSSCYGAQIPCVIDDDMQDLISQLLSADTIIFGSPNYFFNISGILKNFIDRTNPICDPPLLKGKKAAIVCVGARSVEETKEIEKILLNYFKAMKLTFIGAVYAKAEDPGEISKNEDTKIACIELGNKIIQAP